MKAMLVFTKTSLCLIVFVDDCRKVILTRAFLNLDAHPHTPLPNINIPAIEHDINRLEMELASVPASVHQRKHHMKLVTPDTMKAPLINALVTADPEYDAPGSFD